MIGLSPSAQALRARRAAPDAAPAQPSDVALCYDAFLGREADEGGLAYWTERVAQGLDFDDLCAAFRDSEEHRQWLLTGPRPLLDLDQIDAAWTALNDPAWAPAVKRAVFRLPEGFRLDLDPDGPEHRAQQLALWSRITGRADYDAASDEDTPEIGAMDAVLRPAFYATRSSAIAGDHLMGMGRLLKLADLRAGDRALEYGAGFGQIALAFARTGVRVDTVDVNPAFCAAVDQLAARYQVELKAHVGAFGDNPAGQAAAYDLIYFYESFHHCLDVHVVLPKLKTLLKPGGRILLGGEPILPTDDPITPYAWGVRMDAENVAVMRQRGWMELGFQEPYLFDLFARAGFQGVKHPSSDSHYATVYAFTAVD